MKAALVAGGALAVVVGAVLAFLWDSPGIGAEVHSAGLVVMVVGLLALVGVLVGAVIGLRRTGRHRRAGLVADAAAAAVPERPVPARANPPVRTRTPAPAIARDRGSGRGRADDFGSGYEGSHAARAHDEPAARRDTSAGW